jgi:hypothetical protein
MWYIVLVALLVASGVAGEVLGEYVCGVVVEQVCIRRVFSGRCRQVALSLDAAHRVLTGVCLCVCERRWAH